jgi:hypothetical protein
VGLGQCAARGRGPANAAQVLFHGGHGLGRQAVPSGVDRRHQLGRNLVVLSSSSASRAVRPKPPEARASGAGTRLPRAVTKASRASPAAKAAKALPKARRESCAGCGCGSRFPPQVPRGSHLPERRFGFHQQSLTSRSHCGRPHTKRGAIHLELRLAQIPVDIGPQRSVTLRRYDPKASRSSRACCA